MREPEKESREVRSPDLKEDVRWIREASHKPNVRGKSRKVLNRILSLVRREASKPHDSPT